MNFRSRVTVAQAIVLGLLASLSLPTVLHAKDIRIAVPGKSLVFLPLYVGVAQGHFQTEGHSPRVILMQSSLAMNALVSGEIDYATSFGSGIRAAVSGLPVRGIAVYMKTTPFFLIAHPSIGAMRDLKGKKIGITSWGRLPMPPRARSCASSRWTRTETSRLCRWEPSPPILRRFRTAQSTRPC